MQGGGERVCIHNIKKHRRIMFFWVEHPNFFCVCVCVECLASPVTHSNVILCGCSYIPHILVSFLYYGVIECLNLIGWRTFWGVRLFSGKRTVNVVPGSSRPHYMTISLRQIISVISKGLTTEQYPKPTMALAKQINTVNKRIKSIDLVHVFTTKLCFIMYGKRIA